MTISLRACFGCAALKLLALGGLGFAFYGQVLVRDGKPDEARKYADLALQITAKSFLARTKFVVWAYIMPETEPLRSCLQPLQSAYRWGLRTGDVHVSKLAKCIVQA